MRSAMRNRLASLNALARKPRVTSFKEVLGVAMLLWSQLDTPLSLGLSLLANAEQWEDLLTVEVDPRRYLDTDVDLFSRDVQAVAFLKKYPESFPGIDREQRAWTKFLAAEESCRLTNGRFRNLSEESGCSPAVHSVLHSAQWKISGWLRDLNPKSWALRCRFGPGADSSTRQSRVSPYHKLSELSSTEDFSECATALVCDHPSWLRSLSGLSPDDHGPIPGFVDLNIVAGNSLTFVPKTALIDRSIAIEPRLNIYAQLGLGALIRQRLKSNANLDLDTQLPSRELARKGSLDGTVATIDLSSASDTISRELVRSLLPDPWYFALDLCRSKVGLYRKGEEDILIQYEKFSSMGNGFTFELESMIFYALTLACVEKCRDDVSLVRAYGDDISVPSGSVELLMEVLGFCGFETNRKKSFSSGVFRESCGADYFRGVNVRPYYLKEPLQYVESLFKLANGIRTAAYFRGNGLCCDSRYHRLWCHVVNLLPPAFRSIKGPFRIMSMPDRYRRAEGWVVASLSSSDAYLAVNLDEAMSSRFCVRARNGLEGWTHAALAPTGRQVSVSESMAHLWAYALYSGRDVVAAEDSPHDINGTRKVSLRGEGSRRVILSGFTAEFTSVGDWI